LKKNLIITLLPVLRPNNIFLTKQPE
jgi:hypothetical protein